MLPSALVLPLQEHLAKRRRLFNDDLAKGMAEVFLPDALARKYPNAATEWGWQYVFPSGSYSVDPGKNGDGAHFFIPLSPEFFFLLLIFCKKDLRL